MAVELDAGVSLPFRRAEGAPLPMLDGTWRCAELGAEWLIAGDRVQPRGPLRRGPAWHMEAISPGQLRVHMPATPFPAWADVVLDADGTAMTVHGGRARGLRFLRG
jgi:hypothetical protein